MQRLACLCFVITAACTSGTSTGEASLSNTTPPVMSAAAETFTGADASGAEVMGWKIILFKDSPGSDCLEGTVISTIGIFTNTPAGSKPQALLPDGGISIVAQSPPSLMASERAATMSVSGVATVTGLLTITEFHLTADAMHADRISGTIAAGGTDGDTGEGILLDGTFEAPVCEEQ
jgi:hypothetical protein